MVSIIMPTYNRADIIRESIDSILAQTYRDWELIIVDDGSIDNTPETISRIQDSRIRYHFAGKIGLGIRLRNTGISQAKGEWIAFIDSDDCWAPVKLEKQLAAMEKFPDACFSLTGGYNFQVKDKPLEYFYKQKDGYKYGDILALIFRSEIGLLPQTLLFKRVCIPLIEEFSRSAPNSDVEFLFGMADRYKAVVLYEPLLYRRLHDRNFSSNNWEHGYREGIKMIKTYRQKKRLQPADSRQAFFLIYIHYGEKLIENRKWCRAVRNFLTAWYYHPLSIIPLKKIGKTAWTFLKGK